MNARWVILAALLGLGAQEKVSEDEIRRCVATLGSADPAEALAARDRIVHSFAAAALPHLGGHGDLRAEIELNRKLGERYAPPRRVTIEAKDELVTNILAQLESQGNERFTHSGLDTSLRLSLSIQGLTFWSALDEVSRAAQIQPSLAIYDQITLMPGAPPARPRFEYGPFLIVISSVRVDRIVQHGRARREMAVVFHVAWPRDVRPHGLAGAPEIGRIVDGSGRSLLPAAVPAEPPPSGRETTSYQRGFRNTTATVQGLLAPPEDALKIDELAGSISLSFPTRLEQVKFEKPVETIAETREGKGYRAELKSCMKQGSNAVLAEFSLGFADEAAAKSIDPAALEIEFVTQNDQTHPAYLYNIRRDGASISFSARCYNLRRGIEVERITLAIPRESVVKQIPFLFRNVELK